MIQTCWFMLVHFCAFIIFVCTCTHVHASAALLFRWNSSQWPKQEKRLLRHHISAFPNATDSVYHRHITVVTAVLLAFLMDQEDDDELKMASPQSNVHVNTSVSDSPRAPVEETQGIFPSRWQNNISRTRYHHLDTNMCS